LSITHHLLSLLLLYLAIPTLSSYFSQIRCQQANIKYVKMA
jgi:hypothetical protein